MNCWQGGSLACVYLTPQVAWPVRVDAFVNVSCRGAPGAVALVAFPLELI